MTGRKILTLTLVLVAVTILVLTVPPLILQSQSRLARHLIVLNPIWQVFCQSKGGKLAQVGLYGGVLCVIPYPDASRSCTDKSHCLGRCLYSIYDQDRKKSANQGHCEDDNNPFKCAAPVENGKLKYPVGCVD